MPGIRLSIPWQQTNRHVGLQIMSIGDCIILLPIAVIQGQIQMSLSFLRFRCDRGRENGRENLPININKVYISLCPVNSHLK